MVAYQFTDTEAAVMAASRMTVAALVRTGRMPPGSTYENISAPLRGALRADNEAIIEVAAPVIAYDVFMEVRSALQRIVWAPDCDPLTEEQTELWEQITETLAGLNTRITEGGKP